MLSKILTLALQIAALVVPMFVKNPKSKAKADAIEEAAQVGVAVVTAEQEAKKNGK